jgi:hypothetical protein
MNTSREETATRQRQNTNRSLLLRIINDTIDKIRKDSALIVLPSREETLSATLANYLDRAGISLEHDEDDSAMDRGGNENEPMRDLPPLNLAEIKVALDAILGLTVVEKVIFADDLQRLGRKEQEEFIDLLRQHT